MRTSADGVIEFEAVGLLSPGTGSGVSVVVSAVLSRLPAGVPAGRSPSITIVAAPPGSTVPRSHGNVVQAPCDGVIVTPVSSTGTVSATETFVASDGPSFETEMVQDTVVPGTAVGVDSTLVVTRSALVATTGSAASVLSAGFGSVVSDVVDALLGWRSVTSAWTSAVIVTVAEAPSTRSPRSHGTSTQPPCDDVTSTRSRPAGSTSSTCTPIAVDGPLFVTVRTYVTVSPAMTGSGAAVLTSTRSACGTALSLTIAVFGLVFVPSSVVVVTVAELDRLPVNPWSRSPVTITVNAPGGSTPTRQLRS